MGAPPPPAIRRLPQRISMVFFLVLTFGLILLSKAETVVVDRVRDTVNDVMAPVFSVLSVPVQAVREEATGLGEMVSVHERNRQLAEDNRRLREWQDLARHLQAENARLRAELSAVDETPHRFVTARVVADGSGAFARSLLVSAGAADAVDRDLPVVAGGGLVGRVASVGSRSARVLLITDLNSRIPVSVGSGGERAILAGNNSGRLSLVYLADDAAVAPGDLVVTSGHGGIFPPGLAVGRVTRVTANSARVEPSVDFGHLTHVRVLQVTPVSAPETGDGVPSELPLSVLGSPSPSGELAPGQTPPTTPVEE
jgi:rod shape-determining protein MreC